MSFDVKDNDTMSLKEVYAIFSKYWNSEHHLWIRDENGNDFNIKLSINDFIHLSQIDKFKNMKKWNSKSKLNHVKKYINSEKYTFEKIEESLKNINKNKFCNLKKKALIYLAFRLKEKYNIFGKVFIPESDIFPNVRPDIVFLNDTSDGCYLLLCKQIKYEKYDATYSWFHTISLMYYYRSNKKYGELGKSKQTVLLCSKIIEKKRLK